jgi:hypothetical protein
MQKSGDKRLERDAPRTLTCRRKRAHGEAVIASMARDDLVAILARMHLARGLAGDFQRSFDCFRSAVGEKHAIEAGG